MMKHLLLLVKRLDYSLLDNAPNFLVGCIIQKRFLKNSYFGPKLMILKFLFPILRWWDLLEF